MSGEGLSSPAPAFARGVVERALGAGGARPRRLVAELFVRAFADPELARLEDGARLAVESGEIAVSTDSCVVRPFVFPGGDIGRLAVCGTVNDLAMCGAEPLALTAAFVLEEGLPLAGLEGVVRSMAAAAAEMGVRVVAGDTKVVEHARGDGIVLATTGIGRVVFPARLDGSRIRPGDVIVVSGDIGRHGAAVLAAREGLAEEGGPVSDVACIARPALWLLRGGLDVRALRDPTRGGRAAALTELAGAAALAATIDEARVSVAQEVRALCEILGLDPLHLACEGRFVAVVAPEDAERTLAPLRADPLCRDAAPIGRMEEGPPGRLVARTAIRGERVVEPSGADQLPRIC